MDCWKSSGKVVDGEDVACVPLFVAMVRERCSFSTEYGPKESFHWAIRAARRVRGFARFSEESYIRGRLRLRVFV